MILCYESDVLFYAGLSIGLWIASVVGMGCALYSSRKRSYADQIEEMMFELIVKQLRELNVGEEQEDHVESEQEQEQEQEESESEQEQEQEQEDDSESEQETQEDSEQANDADNEQDIEYVNENTQTDLVAQEDLPDLIEKPVVSVEPLLSESSDDTLENVPPRKRQRRGGRGRGRGRA